MLRFPSGAARAPLAAAAALVLSTTAHAQTASADAAGENVTDRQYVYAWYDSGSSGYSPGDGRSATLSLELRF